MQSVLDRRQFVRAGGVLLAAAAVPSSGPRAKAADAGPAKRIRKAVGLDMIQGKLPLEDKLRLAKDAGFEGIEAGTRVMKPSAPDPKELAAASQRVGIPIHGVSNGSHPDLAGAIEEAAILGADTVLHVVRADPKTSLLEQYRASQQALREVAGQAEKRRVKILVENVWATFLIEPMTMARYIDEIGSPWVQSYFDVGNVMRWGWPQHWIEVLGRRIGKIHIKEFSLKIAMKEGMSKAFDLPIGEGDIDWARVREELAKIEFYGWATAEVRGGDAPRLAEIAQQMDRVLR